MKYTFLYDFIHVLSIEYNFILLLIDACIVIVFFVLGLIFSLYLR